MDASAPSSPASTTPFNTPTDEFKAPPPSQADRDSLKLKMEAKQKAAAEAAEAKRKAAMTAPREEPPAIRKGAPKRNAGAIELKPTESVLPPVEPSPAPPTPTVPPADVQAQLNQMLSQAFQNGQIDGFQVGVLFGLGSAAAIALAYFGYKYAFDSKIISAVE